MLYAQLKLSTYISQVDEDPSTIDYRVYYAKFLKNHCSTFTKSSYTKLIIATKNKTGMLLKIYHINYLITSRNSSNVCLTNLLNCEVTWENRKLEFNDNQCKPYNQNN